MIPFDLSNDNKYLDQKSEQPTKKKMDQIVKIPSGQIRLVRNSIIAMEPSINKIKERERETPIGEKVQLELIPFRKRKNKNELKEKVQLKMKTAANYIVCIVY